MDEVNKAGGINGRQVEVIFEDEKDSPTACVNAVQKLINVDKVIAIIGPMTSGGVLAAGPTAESAKTVCVTPTATSPKVSGMGEFVCRGCSRDRPPVQAPDGICRQELEAQERGHPVL